MPVYIINWDFPSKHTQFENQKEVLLRTTFGTEVLVEIRRYYTMFTDLHSKEILKLFCRA
jgi:hypothetical protein